MRLLNIFPVTMLKYLLSMLLWECVISGPQAQFLYLMLIQLFPRYPIHHNSLAASAIWISRLHTSWARAGRRSMTPRPVSVALMCVVHTCHPSLNSSLYSPLQGVLPASCKGQIHVTYTSCSLYTCKYNVKCAPHVTTQHTIKSQAIFRSIIISSYSSTTSSGQAIQSMTLTRLDWTGADR